MKCQKCGRKFQPHQPHHRLCWTCYHQRPRRWHPTMIWLERPELALGVIALGAVILALLKWLT